MSDRFQSPASPTEARIPREEWIEDIQRSLLGWMEAAQTPGAAVALVERGQAPWYACCGVQDLSSFRPVTPQTVIEAASLSKPVFAYGVHLLVAQGILDLDTPLQAILPEPLIPGEERLAQITARHILSHSSGLPNWLDESKTPALLFSPGECLGYSGEGYHYLQRVVEKLLGISLEQFARQRLFAALGMARSSYTWREEWAEETAQGHDKAGCPLPKNKPDLGNAATSLHTTLADYSSFLQQLLSPGTWAGLLQPEILADEYSGWGLGWGLKRISGEWAFWQWGDNTGFKHLAAGFPARGAAVCVLTNAENGFQVWKQVLHATFDAQDEIFGWLSRL